MTIKTATATARATRLDGMGRVSGFERERPRDVATPATQSFPSTTFRSRSTTSTQTSALFVSGLPIRSPTWMCRFPARTPTLRRSGRVSDQPSGTRVELFTDLAERSNFNPMLDDEAAAAIDTAASPFRRHVPRRGPFVAVSTGRTANGEVDAGNSRTTKRTILAISTIGRL